MRSNYNFSILIVLFLVGSVQESFSQSSKVVNQKEEDEFLSELNIKYQRLIDNTDSLTAVNVPENFKNDDAYYIDYIKDYYVKTEKHYFNYSFGAVYYSYRSYSYYPVFYKVRFFTMKIQTEYARQNFQYYSFKSNKFDELLDYKLFVIKPDGKKYSFHKSAVKKLSVDFHQLIKNFTINEFRVPLENLEVGDIISGFVINKEIVQVPQRSFYLTNDYSTVNFKSSINVNPNFTWGYSTNVPENVPEKLDTTKFITYTWDVKNLQGLNGQIYNNLNTLPVVRSVFKSIANPVIGKIRLSPSSWEAVGGMLSTDIEKLSLKDTTGENKFVNNLKSQFEDSVIYSLKDSLDIVQKFIYDAFSKDKISINKSGKNFFYYFENRMLCDSLILNAYIEAFHSLKLPLYYCIVLPRQCGDMDRKIVFFSENFKPIFASRDKEYNWYFIYPVSKTFQMEVNQLPYFYESSDFVAYKFKKRSFYGLLAEPLFGTTSVSTPKQNIIQYTSDIDISPDMENWTVRSKMLLKGNSKFAVIPIDSPEDFNPIPIEMDSLEILKSYIKNNGQLPDSLVLERSISDKKLCANDIGFITKTRINCSIYKLVDSLYLIPVSKITGINPINYLEIPRYYNFDLGYHYLIRSTVNIHFPWNAELQNIADYPLIINNKLGSVKMSIFQKDDNIVQLMVELTLSKIFILSFDHLDIKKFNTDILDVLSRSLVVKRK